ncbi:hypothetical protein Lalb_Chr01g0003931 [Lupinus albus]|uniref:Uncharacterized protein n=1 Tax=Lupinus albus TaxID=3870 RepID=A0A6A4R349_LUPAL|nr:hypothetical protein Lalb_Chr01g0003931 [Lupinus albus]
MYCEGLKMRFRFMGENVSKVLSLLKVSEAITFEDEQEEIILS